MVAIVVLAVDVKEKEFDETAETVFFLFLFLISSGAGIEEGTRASMTEVGLEEFGKVLGMEGEIIEEEGVARAFVACSSFFSSFPL